MKIYLSIILPAVAASLLSACAAPAETPAAATTEPLVHEYRTGSLLVQREKHVTTDEERKRAEEAAAQIRAAGGGFGPGGK